MHNHTPAAIAFIDASLPDLATLQAGLPAELEVHLLDPAQDGLKQIAAVLDGRHDIPALHLITHGAPGQLHLGERRLTSADFSTYANELHAISAALVEDGELLIYGCEVAAGREGRMFIDALTEMTGLKVAAATHKVGHSALGGYWTLDLQTTAHNTQAFEVAEWCGVLAAPIDGVYSFADAVDNSDGTYTTEDGFFRISAVCGEYSDASDDSAYADGDGASLSVSGFYSGSTNDPVGPSSATSYIEVKPEATGSFILNSAVLGETYTSTPDDNDYTNIFIVGYANGLEVVRTATYSSVGLLEPSYSFPQDYFAPFSGKYIDTLRVYFDTPTGDMADRLTLKSLDISGASTTPAPEVPVVHFSYDANGTNSVNGIAQETNFGNVVAVDNAEIYFGGRVDDGAYTQVYEIGGSSGVSASSGVLEYFSLNTYDSKSFFLRQFKVYNDSASDITLTITGHNSHELHDGGLASNPAQKTTTAVAKAGVWTTIDLPGDFGDHVGYRIDTGSGTGTVPVYFNDFALEADAPPPFALDLNGTDDGNDFAVTLTGTPVALADSDAEISGTSEIAFGLDLTQIKAGDKLVFGDPANGGVEIALDNITATFASPAPVSFGGTVINAYNDRGIDQVFGSGEYVLIQVIGQDADAISQLLKTDMKFSGSVVGDRAFIFLNDQFQLTATSTVTVEAGGGGSGGAIALDLDQVGEGNADTNNSTAVCDANQYLPAYLADSATVLGDGAPAEYKKLTISFDVSGWFEDTYPYFGVASSAITDTDNAANYIRLTRDDAYSKVFSSGNYGGADALKLTLAGPVDGARTLTIEKDGGGNLTKSDLNKFLQNAFFYEDESPFDETRVFSLKATAADDSETAVSTFSVDHAPYIETDEESEGTLNESTANPGAVTGNVTYTLHKDSFVQDEQDATKVAGVSYKLWDDEEEAYVNWNIDGLTPSLNWVSATQANLTFSGVAENHTGDDDFSVYVVFSTASFTGGQATLDSVQPYDAADQAYEYVEAEIDFTDGPPEYVSGEVVGTMVKLNYSVELVSDDLDADSFTVTAGGQAINVTAAEVFDEAPQTVILTLASAVAPGVAVTVSYQDPTTGDDDGVVESDSEYTDAASLNDVSIVNMTPVPGKLIVGDGSGGGGGGAGFVQDVNFQGIQGDGGAGGAGGGNDDTLAGTVNADIIFGDGSGGGGGGSANHGNGTPGAGGAAGGGSDAISGNGGNDIIFGDGFAGLVGNENWNDGSGGSGGLGGGGAGGSAGNGWQSAKPGLAAGAGTNATGWGDQNSPQPTLPAPLVTGFGGAGGARGSDVVDGGGNGQGASGGGGGGGYYGAGGAGGPTTLVNMVQPQGSPFPTTGQTAHWAVDGNTNSAGINGGNGQGYTNQIYGVGGDGGTGLEYTYANTWHGGGGGGAGLTTGVAAGSSGGAGGMANDTTFATEPHGQNGEAGNDDVVEVIDSGAMWAHLYNNWSLNPYDEVGGLATLAQAIRDGDVVMGTGSDAINGGAGHDNLFGGGGNDTFVFELNDAGTTDVDTIWDFNATGGNEADKIVLMNAGTALATDSQALATILTNQVASGDDRTIVFAGTGKQVSIVVKGIGRDLVTTDFSASGGDSGGSDTAAPAYQSASINGTTLTLAYDEALKTDGLPAASTFTMKVNGTAVPNGISSVAINGSDSKKLDLTLANPVYFGQTVTISYADPTANDDANAIQDAAGNDAASFVDYGVANNTAATTSVVLDTRLPGEQATLAIGGGLSINNALNSAAPSNLGKSIKMPLGQFAFNITGVASGGTAQLSMTADADLKQFTYYKWNYLTSKYDNIAKSVSIDTVNNKATVFFELVDGGAYDADRLANGTIVDPGGVAENKLLPVILENATAVGDVTALNTDSVNGTLSYAITGGADAAKFSINSSTGALSFNSAPNFEAPTDDGDTADNNTYAVTVTVTGSNGGSEVQPLIVTVMNVPEAGDPTVGSNVTAVEATLTVNAPPSSGGDAPSTPPAPTTPTGTTTVDGATVTTGTTTTTDGRTLDVISIAPVTADRHESTGGAATADIPLYFGNSSATVAATTASLPVGVGLTSTGARTPASNEEALDNLIQLVKDTAGTAEAQKNNMTGGGEKFLAALEKQADKGPLIVNSIKLTVAAGTTSTPDKPITITGSTDKVALPDGGSGRPVEALVIDTRDLPAGTVLDLQNVEFAVIVGDNVVVRGGKGANILYAGSGSQDIMLGEDDDELHAGDGDDVVGSAGGDDLLFGDAGNDTVFGGEGNDTLSGGTGNDRINGDEGNNTVSYADAARGIKVKLMVQGKAQNTKGAGRDTLENIQNATGSDFKDKLMGDSGDNILTGGLGKDKLMGGAGADTFLFNAVAEGGDKIKDFVSGEDQLAFDGAAFGNLAAGSLAAELFVAGTAAQTADQRFIFDADKKALYFDADGNGSGAAVLIGVVSGATLAATDIVIV